ncbi:MAG: DNA double-strand break repair nuclease NurA, partial [Thermoproteota archaeon]
MSEEPLDWVTLPLDLQHRFFEFAEQEANITTKAIRELSSKLNELKKLVMSYIRKFETSSKVRTVAAVDGSRSPRLSERLGVRYGVFATGVVYLVGVKKKDEKFEAGTFKRKQALSQDKSKYFFDLLSTYVERKLALEALEKCDLLILDGSFYSFLYPVLRMKKVGLYGAQEEKLMRETFEITEKIRKSGKAIGIIKRSHTRAIGGYISLKDRENPLVTIIDKLTL